MFNVTLFCTRHGETENCNSFGLYNIILQLKPEIIFEEIPPCFFDDYYKNMSMDNLESKAIKMYLSDHVIKHIPVDLDVIMPQSFWDDNKNMFEQVERRNSEFCRLCDYDSQYARQYGFNYLNSNYNNNINKDRDNEFEKTLKLINNKKLFETYELWVDINEKRENEMIKNIYNYSKENKFDRGVFFIGAAHRESIINKIKEFNGNEEFSIKWNYLEYDNNDVKFIIL
jgi:hypothetical protein